MTEPIKPDEEPNLLSAEIEATGVKATSTKQRGLFTQLGGSVPQVMKWAIGLVIGAVGAAVITSPISSAIENRCTSFPIAYQFIRETTCTPPTRFPSQDFVIVSSKLIGDETVSPSTVEAIGISIDAELSRFDIPTNLGVLHIVPSVDPWIDPARDFDTLKKEARKQAEIRNADIVIYGQVSQPQNVVFAPAFYVHQSMPESVTSLLEVIDPENLGVQIPILEGQSLRVAEWVAGMRAFAIGLQFTHRSAQLASVEGRIAEQVEILDLALQSFSSITATMNADFYEIANLYAGNTALQMAILEQLTYEQNPENACVPRCQDYDPAILARYLTAWDRYTVAVRSGREDVAIRGLIGRGNVQYRLSRLIRTAESDEANFINYDCFRDDSLFFEEDGTLISDANWMQRAQASVACFQQVIRAADDDSIIELKALFGAAQSLEWLGESGDDAAAYTEAFDAYSRIIARYESASVASAEPELTCLSGYSYGQRALIRWDSADTQINSRDTVRKDFNLAIETLDGASVTCVASETIELYRVYLDSVN